MNIYVCNLPFEITADDLREDFIGSGQLRCYVYVEMASKDGDTAAIANSQITRGK